MDVTGGIEAPTEEMGEEPAQPRQRPGSTRALVALLAFILGFATVPHRVCERDARRWFDGDPTKTDTLAAGVRAWTEGELDASWGSAPTTPDGAGLRPALDASSFATGSSRFDGEWLFGTYMMAAMGFGQLAIERPEGRERNLASMERCLDVILDPRVRSFGDRAWDNDALASVEGPAGGPHDRGHVAYLGYTGLALALHRYLRPESRFAAREEAIAAALARRIAASPTGFLETYPGEVYPVDNTSAIAALAVHAKATRTLPSPSIERALRAIQTLGIDARTSLLVQAVAVSDGAPRDAPRASGTALAAYFLSFADPATSRALFRALERRQFRTVLGFGGIMEYPAGEEKKPDIDSGPVVLGFGVSASGFAIGASRAHGDRDTFTALFATAHLFGAPLDEDGTRTYATGGPIGDAILFAMFTTLRTGRLE